MRFMPFKVIHFCGGILGTLLYFAMPTWRKKTYSNLCLAKELKLDERRMKKIARSSFRHLATTLLEYERLARIKDIFSIVDINHPSVKVARKLLDQHKSLIFFCGHQSNWEILFLAGSKLYKGVAIGRPIKNRRIYNWILSIRERFGGQMIEPRQAIRESLRALHSAGFLGIVGDQAMPTSSFSSSFLGTKAYTSTIPALLAYKTKVPIFVVNTLRECGKYKIECSPPIYPDTSKPKQEEVERMMRETLFYMQKDIINAPEQWLWQHNRWKQETAQNVYYRFRHDTILVLIDKGGVDFALLLRKVYPHAFMTVLCPTSLQEAFKQPPFDMITYTDEKELFRRDYQFKLVFNFTSVDVTRHYKKLSAIEVLDERAQRKFAAKHTTEPLITLSDEEILLRAISREGIFWESSHA